MYTVPVWELMTQYMGGQPVSKSDSGAIINREFIIAALSKFGAHKFKCATILENCPYIHSYAKGFCVCVCVSQRVCMCVCVYVCVCV